MLCFLGCDYLYLFVLLCNQVEITDLSDQKRKLSPDVSVNVDVGEWQVVL